MEIIRCLRSAWKKFRLGSQEDSHEFLRIFLDNLQKAEKWLINGIFAGKLKNQVQCLECKAVSEKSEAFMDLSLEVQKSDSIQRSLDIFFKKESLSGNNKYRCGKCKKLVNAWKGFELEEGPMILTIHLKRFNNYLMKINKFVKFSEKLELKQFTRDPKKPLTYELFAVAVHQGSQMWSGHYYSYVKNSNNLWYVMNDETVRLANLERVLKEHAYLLFYVRKDSEPTLDNVNINNPHVVVNGLHLTPNKNIHIPNGESKRTEEKAQINGLVPKDEKIPFLISNVNSANSTATNETNGSAIKNQEGEDYGKRLNKVKETEECREYLDTIFKKTGSSKQQPSIMNGDKEIQNNNQKNGEVNIENKLDKIAKVNFQKVEKIVNVEIENPNKMEIEKETRLMNGDSNIVFDLDKIISIKRSKLRKFKKMRRFAGDIVVKKRKISEDAIKICVSDKKLAKIKTIDDIFESKIFQNEDLEEAHNALLEGKKQILEKHHDLFEKKVRVKDAYDVEYDKGKLKKKKIKREMKKNDFQRALENKNHFIRKF